MRHVAFTWYATVPSAGGHLMRSWRALLLPALVVAGLTFASPPSLASAAAPVEFACTGTTAGSTFTLTANCDTNVPLLVPDGFTLDGHGFTITAHDPVGGFFKGGVVTNG